MYRLSDLFTMAKRVRQTEGLLSLSRRGFGFLVTRFVEYRRYYVMSRSLEGFDQLEEADFMPRLQSFTVRLVASNGEADSLEAEGFEFRSYVPNARQRLDRGAPALCIFVGNELANLSWAAMTQEAMNSLGEPPYRVDFAGGEALGTGVWTNPKYRRLGLYGYRAFKIRQFFAAQGFHTVKSSVSRRNTSSFVGSVKTGSEVCSEGRYLKVLWWRSWRETPLTPEGHGRTGEHGA